MPKFKLIAIELLSANNCPISIFHYFIIITLTNTFIIFKSMVLERLICYQTCFGTRWKGNINSLIYIVAGFAPNSLIGVVWVKSRTSTVPPSCNYFVIGHKMSKTHGTLKILLRCFNPKCWPKTCRISTKNNAYKHRYGL